MRLEISESLSHQPGHTETVGAYGAKFPLRIELRILISYSRAVEIEAYAAHLVNKSAQRLRGMRSRDIYHLIGHYTIRFCGHGSQYALSSACHGHSPSMLSQHLGHLVAYARGGAHDYCRLVVSQIHLSKVSVVAKIHIFSCSCKRNNDTSYFNMCTSRHTSLSRCTGSRIICTSCHNCLV